MKVFKKLCKSKEVPQQLLLVLQQGSRLQRRACCPRTRREFYEPLGLNIQQLPMEDAPGIGLSPPFTHANFHVNGINTANVEHQFIPNLLGMSPMHQDNGDNNPESSNLYSLRDDPEEVSVSLQLGEKQPKRQCSDSTFT